MTYKKYFNSLLLEHLQDSMNSRAEQGSNRYENDPAAFEEQLDDDTESNAFDIDGGGLKQEVERIYSKFDTKIREFSKGLTPENIENLTLAEYTDQLDQIFDYIDSIQNNAKGKVENMRQTPEALIAAMVSSEPNKKAAFEQLHKRLDELLKEIEQIKLGAGMVKNALDKFVKRSGPALASQEEALPQSRQGERSSQPQRQMQPSGGI